MVMEHTPGPWHVANGVQIRSQRDQIAKVWMMRDGEGKANAALIAQAPAMHDLLLRLADAVEALDGTSVENEKLVDDYRAWRAQSTPQPADVRADQPLSES